MNTKNNQRSRETEEKIVRTVYGKLVGEHKPVSKITVREVCEGAEINRSTFYAHYQDVYDVVERVEKTMSEELTRRVLATLDHARSIDELFEQIFAYIYEYREFYSLYFKEMHQSGVIGIAWDLLGDRTKNLSFRELGYKSQREMEYQGEFFIYGMTALLRSWLDHGCIETPREMVEIVGRQYNQNRAMFTWEQ